MDANWSESTNNRTTLLNADAVSKPHKDDAEAEMPKPFSTTIKQGSCHSFCRKSPLTFTLAAAVCFMTQISMGVFTATQITFLEKEFGFSSTQMGQILSASQIGSLCLVLPSGYLAPRLHVPRVMTLVSVVFGLACIMAGLPRFLFPDSSSSSSSAASDSSFRNRSSAVSAADISPAFCWGEEAGREEDERCGTARALGNGTWDSDVVYNPRAYPMYVFLIICQIMHNSGKDNHDKKVIRGAMGSTMFPMFAQYIEANAKKLDTGLYMGIVASVAMLGPAIAFLGGGAISKLHVSLKPTDLTPTHPDWIGAWWLGFLLFGSLAAVAPVFVCWFPRRLMTPPHPPTHPPTPPPSPSSLLAAESPQCWQEEEELRERREGRNLSTFSGESEESHPEKESGAGRSLKPGRRGCFAVMGRGVLELRGFFLSLARLLMNPVYVLLVMSSCFLGFSMNGTYLFLPKYMQDQFQIPIWKANFIMGGSELSMGTCGYLVGGWLTKRLKLTHNRLYQTLAGLSLVTLLLAVAMMLLGCPQATLIGDPAGTVADSDNCTRLCACPEEVFPVCDRESRESYFSPCHAGCSDLVEGVYVNCSCTASGQAYPGECISDCSSVYYFSALFYGLILFQSLSGPVNYLIVIRSLSASQTTQTALGIGLNSFVTGIVSFLAGPLVFGGLIDSFCEHWKTPCGAKAQCSVYDRQRFRVEMHLYSIVAMALSTLCLLLSFLLHRWCPSLSTPSSPEERDPDRNRRQGQGGKEDKNTLEQPNNSTAQDHSEGVSLVNHTPHTDMQESSLPASVNGKNVFGKTVPDVSLSNRNCEEDIL